MKATFRIPTKEYAYIELNEVEVESAEDAHSKYQELEKIVSGQVGLSSKDWNEALDKYLSTNALTSDEYALMSVEQKRIIQEIKKSVKRLDSRSTEYEVGPGKGENGDYSNMS